MSLKACEEVCSSVNFSESCGTTLQCGDLFPLPVLSGLAGRAAPTHVLPDRAHPGSKPANLLIQKMTAVVCRFFYFACFPAELLFALNKFRK